MIANNTNWEGGISIILLASHALSAHEARHSVPHPGCAAGRVGYVPGRVEGKVSVGL